MTRSRLGLLGLCAALLTTMAFATGSAQAEVGAKWLILNEAGQSINAANLHGLLSSEIENREVVLLSEVLGTFVDIECTALTLIGFSLEGEGSLTNGGKIQVTGCGFLIEEEPAPECEAKSAGKPIGTIESNPLKGLLVLHKLAGGALDPLVRIEPKEGVTIVTVTTGPFCPIGEAVQIKGKLFLKDCKNEMTHHLEDHLFEEGPLSTLTLLNNPATLDGSANVFLAGEHKGFLWGGDPA